VRQECAAYAYGQAGEGDMNEGILLYTFLYAHVLCPLALKAATWPLRKSLSDSKWTATSPSLANSLQANSITYKHCV
jgi:hypothetical protein